MVLDRVSPKVAYHGHGRENPSPIEQVDVDAPWAFPWAMGGER